MSYGARASVDAYAMIRCRFVATMPLMALRCCRSAAEHYTRASATYAPVIAACRYDAERHIFICDGDTDMPQRSSRIDALCGATRYYCYKRGRRLR